MMPNDERLKDMLERYGEVCMKNEAARILSVSVHTIYVMIHDGRLRAIGKYIDVRSIYEYITVPRERNTPKESLKQ